MDDDDPECSFIPGRPTSPELLIPYFCGSSPSCQTVNHQGALAQAKRNVEADYLVVGTAGLIEMTLAVLEHKLPR